MRNKMTNRGEVPVGAKVEVYWNLHKKVFSVRARSGEHRGRVIAHVDRFTLVNATFAVSEAGRKRVLAEQRKNVHAFVRGEWAEQTNARMSKVTYNPYRYETFVRASDETPILESAMVSGIASNGHASIVSE
jgi:hypothetical protein